MSVSIYDFTVPVFKKMIPAVAHVLRKAEADAEERNIDPEVLLKARLAPDMLNLTRQVQICTDQVKGCLARLAGLEVPAWPDDEASFAELHERLDKALGYAKSFTENQLAGAETRTIEIVFPQMTLSFSGLDYVNYFVMPNFYFHVTTAYDILRHNGVPIGKRDFVGG